MLSERLRAVMDRAADLPQDEQDKLAEQLEEALDEALWDAQFADPRSSAVFAELIQRAEQQEPLPFPKPAGWQESDDLAKHS